MIFRLFLLLSLVIHAAVFCSVRLWPEAPSFGVDAAASEAALIEVGLIQTVPASSAPVVEKAESPPRPERDALEARENTVPEESRPRNPGTSSPLPAGRAGSAERNEGGASGPGLALIREKIERFLYYPRRARLQRLEGEVKVEFSLTPAGELIRGEVVGSSSCDLLNRAALLILEKAAPFRTAGPELTGKRLSIIIKFKSAY